VRTIKKTPPPKIRKKKKFMGNDYMYYWPIGVDVVELVENEKAEVNYEGFFYKDISQLTKNPVVY
jgi:hypothetical protein